MRGQSNQREYLSSVKVAWPRLAGGVLAIGVGLVVWWTAFILIPGGAVSIAVGIIKSVRSRTAGSNVRTEE
jgi:hypothetical protein